MFKTNSHQPIFQDRWLFCDLLSNNTFAINLATPISEGHPLEDPFGDHLHYRPP